MEEYDILTVKVSVNCSQDSTGCRQLTKSFGYIISCILIAKSHFAITTDNLKAYGSIEPHRTTMGVWTHIYHGPLTGDKQSKRLG